MPMISGSFDEIAVMLKPSAASSLMKAWTRAEPMSMPLVGSSRMMTFRAGGKPLADDDLCWLPPDRVPTGTESAAARRSTLGIFARQRQFFRHAQKAVA